MPPDSTPAWDQEATLEQARRQVRRRVEGQAVVRGVVARWLGGDDSGSNSGSEPDSDLAVVEQLGAGAVIGSDMVIWEWPPSAVRRLSELMEDRNGLLVFIEPTAGLGPRRVIQMTRRRYRRDIPAELRAAGFSVTTQIRLRHGVVGDYVRGEAQHF